MYFSRDAYAYIHITGAEEVRAPHPAVGKRDNLLVASHQHTIVLQGWKFLAVNFGRLKIHVLWRRNTMGEKIPLKSDVPLTEKAELLDSLAPKNQAFHGQGDQSRR